MKTTPAIFIALTNFITNLVVGLIGLRIILKFFGASQSAAFVNWVYETSEPLLAPFIGMFPAPLLEGGFILEFSAIFAILVYSFLGYILIELVEILSIHTTGKKGSKKKA